ncbi:hypothetical protein B6U99_03845 [Candidatus Geothermarchaeota archaeon ex4572_27]|nr:MAG: hypothetical protein B6U99_03845 [Candidatus Geothermarchaeota archaeon ex4572_27]
MVTKREIKRAIRAYLKALEKGDYGAIMRLFAPNAVVDSPLYGRVKADEYYNMLMRKTRESRIKLIQLFKDGNVGAAYFTYEWTLEDGVKVKFDCVDIFYFTADGKIRELKIIYDTYDVRRAVRP